MTKDFTPRQYKFINWLALPRELKEPKTQTEYADMIGVNKVTLSKWKQKEGFKEAVRERALTWTDDALPDVLGALIKEAVGGSAPHIKMYLDMQGIHAERHDLTSGGLPIKTYVTVSPDDWDGE
jgi:hypothetical protein